MPNKPIFFWKTAPFSRILLPFAIGIFAAYVQGQAKAASPWLIACLLIAPTCFSLLSLKLRFRWYRVNGILIHALLFVLGMEAERINDIRNNPFFIGRYLTDPLSRIDGAPGITLLVKICSAPERKPRSVKLLCAINYIMAGQSVQPVTGDLFLYLEPDSVANKLHIGDILIFAKRPERIQNTANPGVFDFAEYCRLQNIFYQLYLKRSNYTVLRDSSASPVQRFLAASRQHIVTILRAHIRDSLSSGLAEALLIGYRADLDRDLIQAYSNTGVVHVVAISGLHLGLIYWILSTLLAPCNRNGLRWLYVTGVLLGLWLFSFLAGGGPSILRSAVMFTFLLTAKHFNRKTAVLNSLAASAFLLLVFDPYWLWDIGFELSYAAVLSLTLFMQPIYHQVLIRNKLLDHAWQMSAVTIAAQVLTVPMTIFYFHQFPTMFLLTNFVAVPLSTIIVFSEIILCVSWWWLKFARFSGMITGSMIGWLNQFIKWMNDYPGSLISDLYMTVPEFAMSYLLIILVAIWLRERKKFALYAALGCMLIMAANHSFDIIRQRRQRIIIFYNLPGRSAIDFFDAGTYCFITDSTVAEADLARLVKPTRLRYRVDGENNGSVQLRDDTINFHGVRLWAPKKIIEPVFSKRSWVDVVLLRNNADFSITRVLECVKTGLIVADGSNDAKHINQWKRESVKFNIGFHAVSIDGPLLLPVKR